MLRLGSWCLTIVAMADALSSPAQAQTGRITGVVRDAGGSPIEAVRVTATNNVTRAARSTNTTADGAYSLSGLTAGSYMVTATLVGYRRESRPNVPLTDEARVDFVLQPVTLQEIVVTATLREQELADVPFSVAAPTATMLRERGADDIEDISVNVAGFSVQNLGPGQSTVALRGASSGQIARDQPGVKESVGAYLDDSPISLSLLTPDMDLFDVSRVEVLRGPQGTLFGAGSLSGTVRYITNQPELGVRSTCGELGGSWVQEGNGGANVKVGTNVPLGDRAAARLAVYHNRLAGYMDAVQPDSSVDENVNTGRRTGVRAALRFAPSDQFSVTPRIVIQRVEMDRWNRLHTFNILANP
jgi:outer membrane receptor protein involved in Fe transport